MLFVLCFVFGVPNRNCGVRLSLFPLGSDKTALIACYFPNIILNTSAVSSINLGSIPIFASCVIHRPFVCPTDKVRVNVNNIFLFHTMANGNSF